MDSLREEVELLFREGVRVASPQFLFIEFWNQNPELFIRLNQSKKKNYVFALGKAAYSMALSFQEFCPVDRGFILTKYGHLPLEIQSQGQRGVWKCREASHPIPDSNTLVHSQEVLSELVRLGDDHQLIVLLSGGGSSLFEIPEMGYHLEDLIKLNQVLLKQGLSIYEINAKRKEYSAVKGGKLLKKLNPNLKVYTFSISDVLGDDPAVIASAPSYPGSEYYVIGNLALSLSAIEKKAKSLGYEVKTISNSWDKSSDETAKYMYRELLGAQKNHQKQAILLGGELVCPVLGKGLGGRNQETALRMAILSESLEKDLRWIFLSCGTDGTDGPTDAAGGIIDSESIERMKAKGWNPSHELLNSNSYPILKEANALLFTGATGTNVNDLLILLVTKRDS